MHTHAHTHTLTFFDFLFSSDSPSLTILVAFHWSVSGPIRFHLRSQDWQKNNNKENMFHNDFVLIFSFFFSLRISVCLNGRGFLFPRGVGLRFYLYLRGDLRDERPGLDDLDLRFDRDDLHNNNNRFKNGTQFQNKFLKN